MKAIFKTAIFSLAILALAPNAGAETPPAAAAPAVSSAAPVATYNGGQISDAQLMQQAKNALMKPLSQIYSIKMDVLYNILSQELLAKEAQSLKTTPEALLKKNATDKVKDPTDAELKSLYEQQKNNKMIQGKKFEEVAEMLKKYYRSDKNQEYSEAYIDTLFTKYNVKIALERPRSEVSVDDDPSQGNPKAPVVIIEFSDFQCPYCKRTRPTIDKILTEYKDKVHYVFRDYPLSFHKNAMGAAVAANCAGTQNKYWEYNRELWNRQGDLGKGEETLLSIAKGLSLNEEKFAACLKDKKNEAEISKDQADGNASGVSGTPAYFINGIFLSGAQPFEAFQEVIDGELKAQSSK